MKLHIALYETLVERVWLTGTPIGVHKELQWVSRMSSVNSPPSPPSPISESIRMHLPNMDRLTGLNYMDTSRDDPDRRDQFLDVSNWESTGWDTVTERLENAPKLNSLATQEYLKTQNP
ncbi:hypothetical protein L1887_21011 [Cichorium endivia]|nr:hypothetical protein L1887_21011 [Cichorium endivia]